MARAKGRDVVIELMDSVAKLEATTTRHADLLESLSGHAVAMSVEMTALSGQVADVSRRMTDVSRQMTDVSRRMTDVSERTGGVSQRVASLEKEVHDLSRGFLEAVKFSRSLQTEVGRLARLLGEFAGGRSSRLDTIEGRLDRLEKKAG